VETVPPDTWQLRSLRSLLAEEDVRARDLTPDEQSDLEVLSLTKNHGLIPQHERFKQRVATENIDKYKVVRHGWIAYNPYVIWEGAIHASRRATAGVVSPVYVVWRPLHDDAGFLDYVLRTPALLRAYQSLSAGAVNRRRSIKKEDFLGIEIACPSMREQRRIASLLNHVSHSIALQEQLLRLAEEFKETLVNHLLTRGLSNEPQELTELGLLPASWDIAPLGDFLVDSKYGLGDKGEPTGTYPLLRMTNQEHGRIVADDLQFIDLPKARFDRFQVRPRDVLFNRTNSHELVGRTAIFDLSGDFVFASYLIRLRTADDRLRPEFLNHYLGWQQTQVRLKGIARRAIGQSNISASRLAGLTIAVPSTQEQDEISRRVDQAISKIEVCRLQLATLNELREVLLSELLGGRLDTKRADISRLEGATTVAQ
jgi:type I restriction enzyme S subunit